MDIFGILCMVLHIGTGKLSSDISLMKMLHEMLHVCEPIITLIPFIANILFNTCA